MRLALAALFAFSFFGTPGEGASEASPALSGGLTRPALLELDRALGFAIAPSTPPYDAALDASRRVVTPAGRVIALPNGCRSVERDWDLVVHFHGAPSVLEPAFERSGIDAVFAIVNLGIGSGAYETAFQVPGTLDALVARVAGAVGELCPGASKSMRRLALSGWSAGYGAVLRILARPRDFARVDSVLLADGLHSSLDLTSGTRDRSVSAEHMVPFTAFADEAVLEHKLFAITHSAIQTPYASTTETADFLLAQEGVTRSAWRGVPVKPGMMPASRGASGAFHVLGFAGADERAHADHLHAFGETLLPYLAQRWTFPS